MNRYTDIIEKTHRKIITDLYNIQYKADLIINGFIGYENSVIFNRFKTKCLLGPKYQILNDYYQKIHKKKKNSKARR